MKSFPFLLLLVLLSCSKFDPKKDIERILEVPLPECYIEVENPRKENPAAMEVVELIFPDDCFQHFTEAIADQSPAAYCGTTPDADLVMAFCAQNDSTFMTINLDKGVLHYEKLK